MSGLGLSELVSISKYEWVMSVLKLGYIFLCGIQWYRRGGQACFLLPALFSSFLLSHFRSLFVVADTCDGTPFYCVYSVSLFLAMCIELGEGTVII